MQTTRTKLLLGTLTLCVMGFALQPSANASANPSAACEVDEANAWAEANAASLPRSLQEIVELPVARQRAVMYRLSNEERASVWREHFAEVLGDPQVRLTAEQERFMKDLDENLVVFLSREGIEAREVLFKRLDVFEPALRLRLFTRLSDATREQLCSCNNQENDCGTGPVGSGNCEVQMHPDLACTPTSWGCGTLWVHGCNGSCSGGGGSGGQPM